MSTELQKNLTIPIKKFTKRTLKKEREYCKIGLTTNLGARINLIRTNNPFPLSILFFQATSFSRRLEEMLHGFFKEKRYYREWFTLTNEDIWKAVDFVEKTWKDEFTRLLDNERLLEESCKEKA